MTLLIVGQPSTAEQLAEAVARGGGEVRAFGDERSEAPDELGSSAPLAWALEALEAEVESERPARVVLADDSDAALAAALVATKMLIPVEAVAAATDPASSNARLIAQLAGPYTLAA